jgi:hypothetical protein
LTAECVGPVRDFGKRSLNVLQQSGMIAPRDTQGFPCGLARAHITSSSPQHVGEVVIGYDMTGVLLDEFEIS